MGEGGRRVRTTGGAQATARRAVTVLGVTGCVGAGKSTVRRILEAAGWSAFDVDAQAALAVSEPHVRNALRDALGPAAKLGAGAVLARLLTSPAERAII